MATYVTLINFTDKGVLHVEDTAKGQYNVVSIVDAPDAASMIALHVDSEGGPITSDDAMRLDPHAYTFKSVGELHMESARREEKFPTDSEMEKAVERTKTSTEAKRALVPLSYMPMGRWAKRSRKVPARWR